MLLEVKNGCFSYGDHCVLQDISLSVGEHDVYAVLGRNGTGKTTLLRCIMGMLPWKSGCSLLNGTEIRRIPRSRLWREIAYVPQAKGSSDLSVRDMIVMGRSAHFGVFGQPGEADYAIADAILQRLYITKLRDKPCSRISGGELQMVLIGRALATKPRLLIMDEPESNLDYHNQMHILKLIQELSAETACILNTHYPEHALRYANKALLLFQNGTGIAGDVDAVVNETQLREAFGINVCIGSHEIAGETHKYIIPLH